MLHALKTCINTGLLGILISKICFLNKVTHIYHKSLSISVVHLSIVALPPPPPQAD